MKVKATGKGKGKDIVVVPPLPGEKKASGAASVDVHIKFVYQHCCIISR